MATSGIDRTAKQIVLTVQEYSLFAWRAVLNLFRPPIYWTDFLMQSDIIGVGSLPIVILSGFFTGGVLALQCTAVPSARFVGGQAFRDSEMRKVSKAACKSGYGAQYGGKHFALDVRIVRLPRHGVSCPVAMGVSCSADRNIKAKINEDGLWIEEIDAHPEKYIPAKYRGKHDHGVVK